MLWIKKKYILNNYLCCDHLRQLENQKIELFEVLTRKYFLPESSLSENSYSIPCIEKSEHIHKKQIIVKPFETHYSQKLKCEKYHTTSKT